ncbi:MAG TPA: ArgE/DapE family deacylase [Gaiellaceae bacterium]|nr:ArgE/DapE family deacylase [Gaiellaceae bacterium]
MGQIVPHNWDAVDAAIGDGLERAVSFLEALVAEPSVVGHELGAQHVVAKELERLGFAVRELEVPQGIEERPGAGVPSLPYAGRPVVVGERPGEGRSLLVNGHVDVVPPGAADLWPADPFGPRRVDGWLHGRGAGDMKAGFAMAVLAIEALLAEAPEAIAGPLSFVSVIEEECTGNGTLAAAHAGVLADAVLLPEPTNLELMLGGIGILWLELTLHGRSAHAHQPRAGANAVSLALPLLESLRALEAEMNPNGDGRHALNIGTFHGGDWQSSVPGIARIGLRIGFPPEWPVAEAQARVSEAIQRAARANGRLAEQPPTLRFNGFRAEGYELDEGHELVRELSAAHVEVHGAPPAIADGTATTDARIYLNQFGVPAVCYGPRVRNIHGIDEAVELDSIAAGARVLARFLARYYGAAA